MDVLPAKSTRVRMCNTSLTQSSSQRILWWALGCLTDDPEKVNCQNVDLLFSFIDDHLATAPQNERKRIDQTLYDVLSRISLYWEVVLYLRTARPQTTTATSYDALTGADEQRSSWRLFKRNSKDYAKDDIAEAARLLKESYEYKFPRTKPDQKWLEAAATSRSKLSPFWDKAAQIRRAMVTDIGWTSNDIEADVERLFATHDTEYLEELQEEAEEILASIAIKVEMARKDSYEETFLQDRWNQNPNAKPELAEGITRTKVRTRGPKTENATTRRGSDAQADSSSRSIVAVKPESLRTLTKMFPSTAESSFKGLVKWQQFVTAMADAGCSAIHVGGSMVSFCNVINAGDSMRRTIVFHKPHPDLNLDKVKLRIMGKSLRRYYGWDAALCAERKKMESVP